MEKTMAWKMYFQVSVYKEEMEDMSLCIKWQGNLPFGVQDPTGQGAWKEETGDLEILLILISTFFSE